MGEGWLFLADNDLAIQSFQCMVRSLKAPLILHNALADLGHLRTLLGFTPEFTDTMQLAYLLGNQPQGLKALAWRLCHMKMRSYREVVQASTHARAVEYLFEVTDREWPDPMPFLRWVGHEKKTSQPRNIRKTASAILRDMTTKPGVDPIARWNGIDMHKGREEVEDELGPMPIGHLGEIPFAEVLHYACRDADATLRVFNALNELIPDDQMADVLDDDIAVVPMVRDMMDVGFKVDVPTIEVLRGEHQVELQRLEREIWMQADEVFNVASPDQVAQVLFGKLKLPVTHRTPHGKPSTNNKTLAGMRDQHPIVQLLIEYREWDQRDKMFLKPIPRHVDEQSRVHGQIKLTRAVTGRMAMAQPNLMQIPQRTEQGRRIKTAFVADTGGLLVAADWSNIELRVLAHLSQDPTFLRAFRENLDLHTLTATKLFEVESGDVTYEQRAAAKVVNFAIAYGTTGKTLAETLRVNSEGAIDMSDEEADDFIQRWFDIYPGVRDHMAKEIEKISDEGAAYCMFGRRRLIPEVHSVHQWIRRRGAREGYNHIIQGSALGIMKRAMPQINYKHYMVSPLVPVHDSLIFEAHENTAEEFGAHLKYVMETTTPLSVPTPVDLKSGKTWAES
jgi:DNA polymerase-1